MRPRFIPTRVGNTDRAAHDHAKMPVHPHACGEYIAQLSRKMPNIGSSPRVWGIPWALRVSQEAARFIPTRVGNTAGASPAAHAGPVHPHACGEYQTATSWLQQIGGSSPRVWGIRRRPTRRRNCLRFIPTRVGNTTDEGGYSHAEPVHPHACGEYSGSGGSPGRGRGSSPRVWGIRRRGHRARPWPRFIPTRVGNTRQART